MGSSDILTSSYGPGVIGTFLALIVVLGFGLLFVFVSDERHMGGGKPIEVVIADDAKEIAELNKRLNYARGQVENVAKFKSDALKLQRAEIQLASLVDQAQEVQSEVDAAGVAIEEANRASDEYKASYRESARKSLKGKRYDELRSLDGKVFTDVVVRSVDPIRMAFLHSNGTGKIDLDQLPEEIQDYLQVSKEEAEQSLVNEIEGAKEYAGQVALTQKSEALKLCANQIDATKRKLDEDRTKLRATRSAIPQTTRQIKTQERAVSRERNKSGGVSRAPAMMEELANMKKHLAALNAAVPKLAGRIADNEEKLVGLMQRRETLAVELDQLRKAADAAAEEGP